MVANLTAWIDGAKTLSELGLVLFAGVQLWQARRASRERKRAAYAALNAEYWRLQAIALDWAAANLVELAREARLHPEELEIRDWAAFALLMGEVGSGTAALGGFAYSLLTQARTDSRDLAEGVRRGMVHAAAERHAAACIRKLNGTTQLLEDALRSAPGYLARGQFPIVDPESEWGKKLQRLMLLQQGRVEMRSAPRLGSVGRAIGKSLASIARWFYEGAAWAYVDPESEWGRQVSQGLVVPKRSKLTRAEPRLGTMGRLLGYAIARVARWLNPAAGWAQVSDSAAERMKR